MVKISQIWKDNDPRTDQRQLKVVKIEGEFAICENTRLKRTTRVRLDRFRPGRTGYTLVYDS
jgi:hypothetical protein